ncbi:MAG: hypothetical protein A3F18_07265 [Legionellales bacterium RIFCSPHIGHO2_12_FULL_37_14]|nr:MAG: hypothetical protein A3F18_07265 [Legionellales bacterium RIFCSPHIGHO2_12_FULL_37_14]
MLAQHAPFDLASLKSQGLLRTRIVKQAELCDFSSNDYLGLTEDKALQKAYQQGFKQYPVGSGASMLISGYHPIHKEFEETFCEAYKAEDALLFSSGYAANQSIAALLARYSFTAIFDKAIHASFYDGFKLAGTKFKRFIHQDYRMMQRIINSLAGDKVLLLESVYSMGGHFTPLDKLALSAPFMIVDEAHAFGLYGPEGLGAVEHFKLKVPLRVIPLGKSLGAMGAIVVGQADWIEALLQVARSYIYSTGISPAYVYGMQTAFTMLRKKDRQRQRIFDLVSYFKQLIKSSKHSWIDSVTPIQHLALACPKKALQASDYLFNKGFLVRAVRQPTVPRSLSGLRVVINVKHKKTDLERLISLVEELK